MSGSHRRRPLVLVILDGWGLREAREWNAIKLAHTPTYLELLDRFPHSSLLAAGDAVGLPAGQMGNSEVGHITMGAGRVVYQDLTRIDKSISDGDFFRQSALVEVMARCEGDKQALHLVGLVSPNGIHSHQQHLHALLQMASHRQIKRVFVQGFTDGRDTSPTGGAGFFGELERFMKELGTGRVASIGGRYYGMDRDHRWERTKRAYDAIVGAAPGGPTGPHRAESAVAFIRKSYEAGVTDEFVDPGTMVDANGQPVGPLCDGDSVIFFNFRSDRARQLVRAIAFEDFDGFKRNPFPGRVAMVTMTQYDRTFPFPVVFPPQSLTASFAEVLTSASRLNLRVAETEKYPHVSYFFNCGIEQPYPGEDRILVPSPKVPTYDLQPEMSATGITDNLVHDVESGKHDVIICNFANADMVGHTGRLDAAIAAVETIDRCLSRIVKAVREAGGSLIITADHGNAEEMWNAELNEPHTAHTSNPVPVIVVQEAKARRLREGGSLRDIAPTMLGILGVEKPKEMTGQDLRVL
jgi:2,3-bisphosphoglycerate-independent phosphoglycerate mutase